ncbi:hypothetical protein [Treponema zioleckii]|uniref:hypothetical protein n=1 Tax=Treponema zioleckii TaxID=331680 RepID=UPI00168B1B75|nr:hypothetical protein [Treponema zioleckii]
MKKKYKKTASIIFAALTFVFLTAFFGYFTVINGSLLIHSEEINAKILSVKVINGRKHTECKIRYEYEKENQKFEDEAEFDWSLLARLGDFSKSYYYEGQEIIICKNSLASQVKNRILFEFIYNFAFFALFFYFLFIIVKNKFNLDKMKKNFRLKPRTLRCTCRGELGSM